MRKLRNIFWIVFALSFLFFSYRLTFGMRMMTSAPTNVPDGTPQPIPTSNPEGTQPPKNTTSPSPPKPAFKIDADYLTIMTAITSLIGAVVTTIGSYRKDKYESKKNELEARKTELDLEERRLELEKKKLDAKIEIARKRRELKELQNKDK